MDYLSYIMRRSDPKKSLMIPTQAYITLRSFARGNDFTIVEALVRLIQYGVGEWYKQNKSKEIPTLTKRL